MTKVADFDPQQLVLPLSHFIGGRYLVADEANITVLRPSDGLPLGTIGEAGEEVVDLAVRNAWQAWRESGWGQRSPRERARAMFAWADLIAKDMELARLEAVSSTRPISQVLASDLPFTAEAIRFFAELADKQGGEVAATRLDTIGMIASEPYGVVGAITPWNFPLSMASWKCGPALAAGNAIVVKPSEMTPFSTLRMAELAVLAGIPEGVFNVVNGTGGVTGAALVRHPIISKISFTGSTKTGAQIMTAAAQSGIKPVTLELGGKSPQLVFENVPDLAHAARCVASGFTANAGQACVSGTRLIVHRRLVEPLIDSIIGEVQKLRPGLTWSAASSYSPIISRAQAMGISDRVEQSVSQGAEVLFGGDFFAETGNGFFYRPTIVSSVSAQMPVVREELFGPVLTVQTFEDEEEGLALADHPTYGLAAGVHTSDIGQALRATRRIAAGTIWVNRYGRSGDMIMPTGGFRSSGIGKDLGRKAMEANLQYKSVLIDFDQR
ncbi:aldehyde dehydrogenase family protein [Pseudomonas asiatica]|uniref:aldehyde dehydrogenase family protein n=1 Tax=Pseudomonas asiatica TaxID=2219225 RepID=UPI002570304E|nr:aldehyde dehydrogenase family protein [Pseudomonas asiatica]WJD72195.1 aldehyde dehydrogenase family protein [Pseudomonas asiatica]